MNVTSTVQYRADRHTVTVTEPEKVSVTIDRFGDPEHDGWRLAIPVDAAPIHPDLPNLWAGEDVPPRVLAAFNTGRGSAGTIIVKGEHAAIDAATELATAVAHLRRRETKARRKFGRDLLAILDNTTDGRQRTTLSGVKITDGLAGVITGPDITKGSLTANNALADNALADNAVHPAVLLSLTNPKAGNP